METTPYCRSSFKTVAITTVCLLGLLCDISCQGGNTGSSNQPPPPPTPGHNYTTQFAATENPISEGGNWINGKATGLDWADVSTTPGKAIGTETGSGGFDDSTAILTGTWNADQAAQATVFASTGFHGEVELRLRSSISAHSCTGYELNFSSGYSQVVRWEGPLGSFTILANNTSVSVKNGDVVKATIIGNEITVFINNVQVNHVFDNTYTKGAPGIGFFNAGSANSPNSEYGFTNFTATDGIIAFNDAAASKKTYSTKFPVTENPLSEKGAWTNGKTLGVDWSNVATTSGLAYGIESGNGGYDDSVALLNGLWKPDQSVEATVYSKNQREDIFQEVELRLRSSLARHIATGYEINFRCLKTDKAYTQIVRWNGKLGKFSYLNVKNGAQFGVKNGDVVKATMIGNVITVFINGVQVNQATDNTYASGSPGIGFYLQGASGSSQDYGFSSFSATDQI
jgi:hypothetical protein